MVAMIPDYAVVACLLYFVSMTLIYWPVSAICTIALWALFTIRIGNQRDLQLEDLMQGENNG